MAVSPSAPAARVVDVLVALAADPGAVLGVSAVAEAAGVNRTTCYSILLSLEERGWAARRPDGSWRLGAGMIPMGDAALASLDIVEDARPELDALVRDLGMEALASVVSGAEIVVVAHSRLGGVLANTVRMGQTLGFAPPFGIVHLVGAEPAVVEAWLDRATSELSAADREAYRRAIEATEQLGYSVVLDAESRRRFEAAMGELAARPASRSARRRRDDVAGRLEREGPSQLPWGAAATSGVSQISAAVVGPHGRPVLAIGVHAQPHQIEPAHVTEIGARVALAAERITRRSLGTEPSSC
jgi:DNA-binding IclR family transcriptional regulator